ncbi:hypothetical protein C8R43DRAFT_827633, partial [Mycena crocata]
ARPFMHYVTLEGPQGEKNRVFSLFDLGAMVSAMDTKIHKRIKNRLGTTGPPTKRLRMADGRIIDSVAHWDGSCEIDGVRADGGFEVFDSGGGWDFLFGKPLQAAFGVIHDVAADSVTLNAHGRSATLRN